MRRKIGFEVYLFMSLVTADFILRSSVQEFSISAERPLGEEEEE